MTKVGPILAISSILLTGQLSSLSRPQSSMPPLVHLEIGARLKADQTLPGLYLLILDCTAGSCSLLRISMNECRSFDRNQGPAFVPAAERATTWDQTLTVTPVDGAFIVEEAVSDTMASQSKISYRFEYAKTEPAKPITRLRGFSGSFTRNGANRQKVEFVPLSGTAQQVQLDCPVRLPGIGN